MTKLQVKERPKPSCFVWTSNRQIVCESAQTRFHIKSPPCLFIKTSVLSLARPNFLSGAIMQTRIQASLLPPPPPPPPAGSDEIRNHFKTLEVFDVNYNNLLLTTEQHESFVYLKIKGKNNEEKEMIEIQRFLFLIRHLK